MKSTVLLALCALALPANASTLIAFWNFNDAFTLPNNTLPIVQIVHSAVNGSGIIYQQRADILASGNIGNSFSSLDPVVLAEAGTALSWNDIAKTGANDAELFIVFSTTGLNNILLSFDVLSNMTTPLTAFDLKYSINALEDVNNQPDVGGTIKDFAGGLSTVIYNNQPIAAGTAFQRFTYDLSSVTALNNAPFVALRLDDFAGNTALRFDNVLITAVPEASTSILALGAVLLTGLRRRR
jgi:hypothetical protein